MKRNIVLLTLLNIALLANLYAVIIALASYAASLVWWSNVLLALAPILAVVGVVLALRKRAGLVWILLNAACLVPYALFFTALSFG